MAMSARAVPLVATPVAKAPSARRSSVPFTFTSTRAGAAARSTPPVTTSGLPSESHRSSSILTRPFSRRSRVGTICLNGTPARVSDASSSTAVARVCSIDSAPASAVMVNAIVPATSRSASAPVNGSSILGVMPVTRADSAARAGSGGSDAQPSRRPPVRRRLAIRVNQRARDQPPGTEPSAEMVACCQAAPSDRRTIRAGSTRASTTRPVAGGRSP